ncbi:CPBP family intramembrane glutamic endopeptidase [Clostridium sp.]|uniref:CPBP family intramembrane glutamic endopeptidase n=1 Tax=Clostridium sp. TaxID=1506 RepID=UPI001D9226DF|nr:type II CAAX endopeptidase family protein [Clostridium sp.]MBS5939542.1 CPBP family intramembrane metalloprotease [Clostridium sp.]
MSKVLRSSLYFLFILVAQALGTSFLILLYRMLGISDPKLILFLNHLIILIIPAIIFLLISKEPAKKTLRLNKLHWQDTLLVILLGFVVQPVMTFFSLITVFFFNNNAGEFMGSIVSAPYPLLLAVMALLPTISEEITLRGIILSGYNNKNRYVAAAITGLFFGILHLDPQQFLYTAALGFIFALVVRITNSIYSSMIMHFIINGTSVTMLKITELIKNVLPIANETAETTLKNISSSEKLFLFIFYGIIAIIFSIFVFLIIYWLDKINKRRELTSGLEEVVEFNNENKLVKKERVINIPFILAIVFYVGLMVIVN